MVMHVLVAFKECLFLRTESIDDVLYMLWMCFWCRLATIKTLMLVNTKTTCVVTSNTVDRYVKKRCEWKEECAKMTVSKVAATNHVAMTTSMTCFVWMCWYDMGQWICACLSTVTMSMPKKSASKKPLLMHCMMLLLRVCCATMVVQAIQNWTSCRFMNNLVEFRFLSFGCCTRNTKSVLISRMVMLPCIWYIMEIICRLLLFISLLYGFFSTLVALVRKKLPI